MIEASVGVIGYFVPIFAFLLVFIVVYALLAKTKVLGDSPAVMLFISFILSSFFIVEASLVDFVQFTSAWFGTAIILLFFLIVILAFIPDIKLGEFFGNNNWFAWVLLVVVLLFFVFSSSYVFNWVLNWDLINSWFGDGWFGFVLLLVIAGFVSWRITK